MPGDIKDQNSNNRYGKAIITPPTKDTKRCIVNCPAISIFIKMNGISLIHNFSEILHKKIYVGKVFSLQAKIILSKINDLLKNAIAKPIRIAISDLVKCVLKASK